MRVISTSPMESIPDPALGEHLPISAQIPLFYLSLARDPASKLLQSGKCPSLYPNSDWPCNPAVEFYVEPGRE